MMRNVHAWQHAVCRLLTTTSTYTGTISCIASAYVAAQQDQFGSKPRSHRHRGED